MKKNLKILLSLFSLLIFFSTNTYGQKDYWEKAELKYNTDHRQRIVDNMNMGNSSSVKNGSGTDNQSLQNLVNSWKVKPGKDPALLAQEKQNEEERKRQQAELAQVSRQIEEKYSKGRVPFEQQFKEAGFCLNPEERMDLTGIMVSAIPERTAKAKKLISNILSAKKIFEQEKNNASLERLLPLISIYAPTWETALQDLNFIEQRFPQQKSKIDTTRFSCYAYYFGAEYPHIRENGQDYFSCYSNTDYKIEALDNFLNLADLYPELAKRIVSYAENYRKRNPFHRKLGYLVDGVHPKVYAKSEEAKKLCWLSILTLPPYRGKDFNFNCYNISWYALQTDYIHNLTQYDWIKISEIHNGSPMNVIKKVYLNSYELNVIPNNKWTDKNGFRNFSWDREVDKSREKQILKTIEKIASIGDAEALNTLGVVTAMGLTSGKNKDCIWMFEEAAKNGSVWAQFNLVFAGGFNLRGYQDEDKQKALTGFANFINNADSITLDKAVGILYKMGGRKYINSNYSKEWYWYNAMPSALIGDLLKKATAKGNGDAKYYLDMGYAW